jgi:hypothetical protein
MSTFPRSLASRLVTAGFAALLSTAGPLSQSLFAQSSVRQVKVVGSRGAVEIEVEATDRIVPQTQVLTGPDRLVVDFPNSLPGTALRNQSVNMGQVKDVRFGLFQSNPPVTRLVLDLKSAQSYQIFPSGRTVMSKVVGSAAEGAGIVDASVQQAPPGLVNASYTAAAEGVSSSAPTTSLAAPNRPHNNIAGLHAQANNAQANSAQLSQAQAKPALEVSFRNGLLSIKANKATFSEVLIAIQQRTGADIAIPAGAEQERIAVEIGPGQPQEVLASLLNGSNFNFLILNSANDPRQLDRVILTPRTGGPFVPSSPSPPVAEVSNDDPEEPPEIQTPPRPAVAAIGQQRSEISPPSTTPTPAEDDAPINQ